jgi:hypothetical protein
MGASSTRGAVVQLLAALETVLTEAGHGPSRAGAGVGAALDVLARTGAGPRDASV